MEPRGAAIAVYRELAPCDALAPYVYAFFTFAPPTPVPAGRVALREAAFGPKDSFCSPMLADGSVSLVFSSGRTCDLGGRWRADPAGAVGRVIGPMSAVGEINVRDCAEGVGVYFRPGRASGFLGMPVAEVADRIADTDDVWGASGRVLALDLCELGDAERVDRFETALLARLGRERSGGGGIDAAGLASHVLRCAGRVSVERLADAAGVSRQHLTREFRGRVGLAPKTYCSLARFQSGLVYAGRGNVDWARASADLGYADQSHMIAEFRRFSSLTPNKLAGGRWFHPFIDRAIDRAAARVGRANREQAKATVVEERGGRSREDG